MASTNADVGDQIEALLARLRDAGGPVAASIGEELVRTLVAYYGEGLGRVVEIVGEHHPDLVFELAGDPLVESQLILHGLHPLSVDERVEAALDRIRPYLGSHAGGVAYLGIDDEAVAHLRLDGSCHGCPSSTVTVRMTIEEAVLGAAPELAGIEVEGQVEKPKPLLQIGKIGTRAPVPAREAAAPVWLHPAAPELPAEGRLGGVHLDGRQILMLRRNGGLYAYADSCPSCGGSLVASTLTGDILACGSCGARYDIRLAGKALDGTGRFLDPLPLLDDVSGVRVAMLPEAV